MFDVVKIVDEKYENTQDLCNLLNYIFRDKDTGGYCRYFGSVNTDPYNAMSEMMYIKECYRKNDGRQARHFVVSLGNGSLIIPYEANQLAMQICAYYANRFQIVYSVHDDTDNLHIHFVLNTVSYVDGKKFTESPAELWRFKEYVGMLINRYIH